MKLTSLLRVVLLSSIVLAGAEGRTWTNADGSKTFEAKLKSYDAEKEEVVVTLSNGSMRKFAESFLSADDIAYLKKSGGSSGGSAKALAEVLPDPDGKEADMSKPVQVFILMGQSNMLGFGKVAGDKAGTLEAATKNGKYPYLVDEAGAWTTRKDVRNVRVMNFKDFTNDWMSPSNSKNIGPEMGIGYALGEAIDAPVLILKSCIGNRSLGWDLLPPGSEPFEAGGKTIPGYRGTEKNPVGNGEKVEGEWYAGKQYDDDTDSAKKVLENLDKYYPGAKGYEIAGFIFWQGDKDTRNAEHAKRYEFNLVQFIKALRKDFEVPDAKFVCATLGQTKKGSSGAGGDVLNGQMAVDGESGKYDDFKGNVATVYAHPLSKGGSSGGHYSGNAETYQNIGEALGRAMAGLLVK